VAEGRTPVAEPQLSVRSAKAHDIAHRLAVRENRSLAEIVERALEVYESREVAREPAAEFHARLKDLGSSDVDLEQIIRAGREPHTGLKL
jgi:hypothetical protein